MNWSTINRILLTGVILSNLSGIGIRAGFHYYEYRTAVTESHKPYYVPNLTLRWLEYSQRERRELTNPRLLNPFSRVQVNKRPLKVKYEGPEGIIQLDIGRADTEIYSGEELYLR